MICPPIAPARPSNRCVLRKPIIAAERKASAALCRQSSTNFARYVVQGVTQEMDVAALPDGFRQDFANCRLQPTHDCLTPLSSTPLSPRALSPRRKSLQLERLSRLASSTPRSGGGRSPSRCRWRSARRWLTITHGLARRARSGHPHDQVREGFCFKGRAYREVRPGFGPGV